MAEELARGHHLRELPDPTQLVVECALVAIERELGAVGRELGAIERIPAARDGIPDRREGTPCPNPSPRRAQIRGPQPSRGHTRFRGGSHGEQLGESGRQR
jgi:hypothetical protein